MNVKGTLIIKMTRIKDKEDYKVEIDCEGRKYKGSVHRVKKKEKKK